MLSHLAFVCAKEGRPCPLYAVGCNEVHSLADADSSSHLKLLLEARVSGACGVSLYSNDLISKYLSMNILVNKYLPLHLSSCKPTTIKTPLSSHSRGNWEVAVLIVVGHYFLSSVELLMSKSWSVRVWVICVGFPFNLGLLFIYAFSKPNPW